MKHFFFSYYFWPKQSSKTKSNLIGDELLFFFLSIFLLFPILISYPPLKIYIIFLWKVVCLTTGSLRGVEDLDLVVAARIVGVRLRFNTLKNKTWKSQLKSIWSVQRYLLKKNFSNGKTSVLYCLIYSEKSATTNILNKNL